MEQWRKEFGKKIKALREGKQYSQEQLGQLLDLTRASIINIENGRHLPTLVGLLKICSVFGVTPSDLLRVPTSDIKSIVTTERRVVIKKKINKKAKFNFKS